MNAAHAAESLARGARRTAISQSAHATGIDSVDVASDPAKPHAFTLLVHFIPSAPGVTRQAVPDGITRANILITGPDGGLRVEAVEYAKTPADTLRVRARRRPHGREPDLLTPLYTLALVDVAGADPLFSRVSFRLDQARVERHDCFPQEPSAVPAEPQVFIDYLNKDYSSFRRFILDKLNLWVPSWRERNPSDLGVVLVEALAYAGDYLSYQQDAAATEAYLETARQRISVRRHVRLVDYRLSEGCNSRVWVHVAVHGPLSLPKGQRLVAGANTWLIPEDRDFASVDPGARVFESMHAVDLCPQHNRIEFYLWGESEGVLRRGSTSAVLRGAFPNLHVGDALILELSTLFMDGCELADASAARHRHALRLAREPEIGIDELYGQHITRIDWFPEDALPRDLPVRAEDDAHDVSTTVARGNLLLADSGQTLPAFELPMVVSGATYRPALPAHAVTFRQPYDRSIPLSAVETMKQDPHQALPAIELEELHPYASERALWTARPDLLSSTPFAREFVLEIQSDRTPVLRFGDGQLGLAPLSGTRFLVRLRSGAGPLFNVGPDTVTSIVSADTRIAAVRNPLAASGACLPETVEAARLRAPFAFRTERRCVTAEDYRTIASKQPGVLDIALERRNTGSWTTDFLYVQRAAGAPCDRAFLNSVRSYLEPFRLIGRTLYVRAPRWVLLDIVIEVRVEQSAAPPRVERELDEACGNHLSSSGQPGFFYPPNLHFGQPVYLSALLARIMEVPGVAGARALEFTGWGRQRRDGLASGMIALEPAEIARVDNDAAAPQNGQIRFIMRGTV